MKEIIRFEHKDFGGVRALKIKENPWFVAMDVAGVLGYQNARTMTRRLDDDEKGVQILHTLGGPQEVTIINEPGLYNAIFGSQKPNAKKFKRWVIHDILPSIRKHGFYQHSSCAGQPLKNRKITHNMVKMVAMSNPKIRGQLALRALQAYTDVPVDDLLEQQEMYDAEPSSLMSAEIQRFVAENCSFGTDLTENATALYHSFLARSPRKPGSLQVSQKKFGATLSQFYPKIKRKGLYVYCGLELKLRSKVKTNKPE